MVNYKILALVLLLLAFIPLSQALQLENFTFYGVNQELNAVALQKTQFVSGLLTFSVEQNETVNETIESVILDARNLNKQLRFQTTYRALELNCEEHFDNQTNKTKDYTCRTGDMELYLQTAQPQVFLDVQTNTGLQTINHTFSFTVDNTQPKITDIGTEYVHDGKYYIKSGGLTNIIFSIEDSIGTFNQRKLFYILGNSNRKIVSNCTQTSCQGESIAVCGKGQQLSLTVTEPSADDAGNAFTGQLSSFFICDVEAPGQAQAITINISHNNPRYPQARAGENISVHAYVSEDASGVSASANFTELTGISGISPADCTPLSGGGLYDCYWQVSGILPGEAKVNFSFVDGVGRETKITRSILVDNYIRGGNVTVPQFFKNVIGEAGSEKGFNRIALELAQENGIHFPIFAYFTPQRNLAEGYADSLNMFIDPTSCELSSPDFATRPSASAYFDNIVITDSVGDFGTKNRVDFFFSPSFDVASLSNVDVICNVSVVVRANKDTVYQKPSQFQLSMPLKFKNSALSDEYPGEKYAKKIQEKEDGLDDFWAAVGIANNIAATMSGICSVYGTLSSVSMDGRAMQLGVALVGRMYPGIGSTLQPINALLGKVAGTANKFVNTDSQRQIGIDRALAQQNPQNTLSNTVDNFQQKGENILQTIFDKSCQWTTCSVVDEMKAHPNNFYFKGTNLTQLAEQKENLGGMKGISQDVKKELFSGVNVPNPQESVLSAIFTKCWSALVYHLNKFREMKCGTLVCMKEQARYGLDVSVCDQIESRYVCEAIVGEFFELPYVREIKNIGRNADSFVQNLIPNTLKLVTSNVFCQKTLTDPELGATASTGDTVKLAICHLPEAIGNQLNYQIKSHKTKEIFHYPIDEDFCATSKNCTGTDCDPISSSYLGRLLGSEFSKYEDLGNSQDVPEQNNDTGLGLNYDDYLNASNSAQHVEGAEYLNPNNWPEGSPEAQYVNYLNLDYKKKQVEFQSELNQVDEVLDAEKKDFNLAVQKHESGDYVASSETLNRFLLPDLNPNKNSRSEFVVYLHKRASILELCNDIGLGKENFKENFKDLDKFNDLKVLKEQIFDDLKKQGDVIKDGQKKTIKNLNLKINKLGGEISALKKEIDKQKNLFTTKGSLSLNIDYLADSGNYYKTYYNKFTSSDFIFYEYNSDGTEIKNVTAKTFYSRLVEPADVLQDPTKYMGFSFNNFQKNFSGKLENPDINTPLKFIIDYNLMKNYHEAAKKLAQLKKQQELNKTELANLQKQEKVAQEKSSATLTVPDACSKLQLTEDDLQQFGGENVASTTPDKMREELKKKITTTENADKIDAAYAARENAQLQLTTQGNAFMGELDQREVQLNEEKTNLEKKKNGCKKNPDCISDLQNQIDTVDQKIDSVQEMKNNLKKSTPDYMNPTTWKDDKAIQAYVQAGNAYTQKLDDYNNRVAQHADEQKSIDDELATSESQLKILNCPESNLPDCQQWSNKRELALKRQKEINQEIGEKPTDDSKTDWKKLPDEQKAKFENAKKEYNEHGAKYNEKTMTDELLTQQRREQAAKFQNNLKAYVDLAAAAVVREGWVNWAIASNYGHDTTAGKVSQFSNKWLNPDSWKQSICSPDFIVTGIDNSVSGTAISCAQDYCVPVLTQAAERMQYNDTNYLYTLVYYLKQIPPQTALQDEQTVHYTVYLKTSSGHADRLFANPWEELANEPQDFAKSFLSQIEYTKVCVEFEFPFPAGSPEAKKEYCRDIVDSTQGESVFDTGDPLARQLDDSGNIVSPETNGESLTPTAFTLAEGFN